MPQMDVHLVPCTNAPNGLGEQGLLALAVASALFQLPGMRGQRLPPA